MNSISWFLPLPPLLYHLKPNQLPSFCNFGHITNRSSHKQRFASLNVRAIQTSLILAANSPSNSGDLSVLLQTGGLLLIVYFIANFIVPEFIMKSYGSEESEEGKSEENAAVETDQARSSRKKQGFGSDNR